MNKTYLTLIALITLIGLASAEITDLGIFSQGDCIRLIQICGNCTYVNITSVMNPDTTVGLSQVSMQKIGTEYNYSCSPSSQAGTYLVNGKGDPDGVESVFSYKYTIKILGDTQDNNFTQGAFFIGLALIVSIFMYIKVSRFFGSMMVFVIGIGILLAVVQNGWIGWIIMASGFLMMIYSIMTPKSKKRRY